jgi:hypothetical protein
VLLGQREWPHIYPANIGIITMRVYHCYELMPAQRTAAINNIETPEWPSPDDSDSPADAELRSNIINTYVHYPYDEALRIVDEVRARNPTDKNLMVAEQALAQIAAEQEAAPFSHVVPGPLDGPLAGSGRQSKSKDPLTAILTGKRSTRNPSAEYVEDPDSDVEVEDGLESDEGSEGARPEEDEPTILYICDTGTVYTIDSEYQAAITGNYLAEGREDEMLVVLPGAPTAFDRDNYAMCRESQPMTYFHPAHPVTVRSRRTA